MSEHIGTYTLNVIHIHPDGFSKNRQYSIDCDGSGCILGSPCVSIPVISSWKSLGIHPVYYSFNGPHLIEYDDIFKSSAYPIGISIQISEFCNSEGGTILIYYDYVNPTYTVTASRPVMEDPKGTYKQDFNASDGLALFDGRPMWPNDIMGVPIKTMFTSKTKTVRYLGGVGECSIVTDTFVHPYYISDITTNKTGLSKVDPPGASEQINGSSYQYEVDHGYYSYDSNGIKIWIEDIKRFVGPSVLMYNIRHNISIKQYAYMPTLYPAQYGSVHITVSPSNAIIKGPGIPSGTRGSFTVYPVKYGSAYCATGILEEYVSGTGCVTVNKELNNIDIVLNPAQQKVDIKVEVVNTAGDPVEANVTNESTQVVQSAPCTTNNVSPAGLFLSSIGFTAAATGSDSSKYNQTSSTAQLPVDGSILHKITMEDREEIKDIWNNPPDIPEYPGREEEQNPNDPNTPVDPKYEDGNPGPSTKPCYKTPLVIPKEDEDDIVMNIRSVTGVVGSKSQPIAVLSSSRIFGKENTTKTVTFQLTSYLDSGYLYTSIFQYIYIANPSGGYWPGGGAVCSYDASTKTYTITVTFGQAPSGSTVVIVGYFSKTADSKGYLNAYVYPVPASISIYDTNNNLIYNPGITKTTNLRLTLDQGTYRLNASADGYKGYYITFSIQPRNVTVTSMTLPPIENKYGTLVISRVYHAITGEEIKGVNIVVNGSLTLTMNSYPYGISLQSGNIYFDIYKGGYYASRYWSTIKPGETTTVTIKVFPEAVVS